MSQARGKPSVDDGGLPPPKPPAEQGAGEGPRTYAFNFKLTTAERVRAMVAGPPAWSLRLLRIERLEEEIVAALVAEALRSGSPPVAIPPLLAPKVAALDQLVATHNTYYPIEANLPSDPRTREVMEGGRPWQPMEVPRAQVVLARARERSGW